MKQLHALISALVVGCFAAVAIPAAKAVPINGTITFSPPDPNTFGSVTTVAGTTTVAFPTPMLVQTTVGDYNAVPLLTPATFTNFSFTGSGAASTLVGAPITVWTVGGFSFQLTSLLSTTVSPGVFSILGSGIASGAGFQDTAGVFSLSGTGTQPSFTFQASTTASGVAVPDGGATVALLGLTLVGLEAMRRKLVLA